MATLWYRSRCWGNVPECGFRPHGELKACTHSLTPESHARWEELFALTGNIDNGHAFRLVVTEDHEDEVVRIARRLVAQPDNPFGDPLIDILAVEGLLSLEVTGRTPSRHHWE